MRLRNTFSFVDILNIENDLEIMRFSCLANFLCVLIYWYCDDCELCCAAMCCVYMYMSYSFNIFFNIFTNLNYLLIFVQSCGNNRYTWFQPTKNIKLTSILCTAKKNTFEVKQLLVFFWSYVVRNLHFFFFYSCFLSTSLFCVFFVFFVLGSSSTSDKTNDFFFSFILSKLAWKSSLLRKQIMYFEWCTLISLTI